MEVQAEIWKPIAGFEGCYEVSSLGKIRSIDRYVNSKNGAKALKKGRFMSPRKDIDGYMRNVIKQFGKSKCVQIHREVAKAFMPRDSYEGLVVNHKNGIRDDNRVENLEWVTIRENVWHSSQFKGEGKKTSKYVGVCKTPNGTWQAYISVNSKTITIGTYKTEEEAYTAKLDDLKERGINTERLSDNYIQQSNNQ